MKKVIIILTVTIITCFLSSIFIYNSYDAKVSEDYRTVEYNDNTYIRIDWFSLPKDCEFETTMKAYQCGNNLYSQWLVSPMCYISNDEEYIKLITENDTIDSKVLYYKMSSTDNYSMGNS